MVHSLGTIKRDGQSMAARPALVLDPRAGLDHPAGVWLREPVREMTVFSEQYDFCLFLLLLEDEVHSFRWERPDDQADTYDKFAKDHRRREW